MADRTRLELLDEALADSDVTPDPDCTSKGSRVWVTPDGRTRIVVLAVDHVGRLLCAVTTDYDGRIHQRLSVREHEHGRLVRLLEALDVVHFPYEPDPMPGQLARMRLAWESARVGRREARTWISVAARLGAHVERLRAELTEAQRDAEQSRATAHGLGRDYRQARAELESKRDLLRLAEESARDAQQELEHTDQRAVAAEAKRDRLAEQRESAVRAWRDEHDALDRLAEQVRRVRVVHARRDEPGGPFCAGCGCDAYEEPLPWPCPTIRALDGEVPTPR